MALCRVLFGRAVLAELEVDPAEGVEEGSVLRVELDSLLDHLEGLGQVDATIGEHVAEVVEDRRIHGARWIDGQGLAVLCFRLVVLLVVVIDGGALQVDVAVIVGSQRERVGLVEIGLRFGGTVDAQIDVRDGDEGVAIIGSRLVGRSLQLRLGKSDGLIGLAGVGELEGVEELDVVVFGRALAASPAALAASFHWCAPR